MLDGEQLQRHADRWGLPAIDPASLQSLPEGWRLIRWADVHAWACSALELADEPVAAFLLDQFVEFLEFTGLAPRARSCQKRFRLTVGADRVLP